MSENKMNKSTLVKKRKLSAKIQKNLITNYTRNNSDSLYLKLIENREEVVANTQNADISIETAIVPVRNGNEIQIENENENENEIGIGIEIENENISKNDYEILKKKCSMLESENQKLLKDNKKMKLLLKKYEHVNMLKDIEIQQCNDKTKNAMALHENLPFGAYEHLLKPDQLRKLRSMKKGLPTDSTFVRIVIENLFSKIDIDKMCVSKKGTAREKQRKMISPSKKQLIVDMLEERVGLENLPYNEKLIRCERVNTLIGFALNNIRKPHAKNPPSSTTTSLVNQNQFTGVIWPNMIVMNSSVPIQQNQQQYNNY